MKLNSSKLRRMENVPKTTISKKGIYIVLDNVLDTYNVGAVFRLADAVTAEKIFLCGHTDTPPNSRIKKSAINTTDLTAWAHFDQTTDALKSLREEVPGIKILAIEQNPSSIDYTKANYSYPVALIIGNETHGVSDDVMKLCDQIVELPMFGVNVSLNTMVSLAIVLYKALEQNH